MFFTPALAAAECAKPGPPVHAYDDGPELGLDLVERGRDLLGITDVARHRGRLAAELLQRGQAGLEVLGLAARDRDGGPEPGELERDALAQARTATRDEHHLIVERPRGERGCARRRRFGKTGHGHLLGSTPDSNVRPTWRVSTSAAN